MRSESEKGCFLRDPRIPREPGVKSAANGFGADPPKFSASVSSHTSSSANVAALTLCIFCGRKGRLALSLVADQMGRPWDRPPRHPVTLGTRCSGFRITRSSDQGCSSLHDPRHHYIGRQLSIMLWLTLRETFKNPNHGFVP